MGKWLRRVASIGGTIAVICFFLPWVLVSCSVSSAMGIEASGYEIASGNYSELRGVAEIGSLFGESGAQATRADPVPLVWLVPVFGLLGLAALNGKRGGSIAALVGAVLGMLALIIFAIQASSIGDRVSLAGFRLDYRIGYWTSWLAFLAQGGAAAVDLGYVPLRVEAQPAVRRAGIDLRHDADDATGEPRASPPGLPLSGPLATLKFLSGPLAGRSIRIDRPDVMIGRSSTCDIQIKDGSVSRQHARLRLTSGCWYVQDQQSLGGTFIDGVRIDAQRLGAGARVSIGDNVFVVRIGEFLT